MWKSKILIVLIVVLLSMGALSGIALAGFPPQPKGTPTPVPNGGGGGGGGSYSAPVFAAYALLLKSSDGAVIGHFDGKNYNSVLVFAEKNGTAGNVTYDLTVNGELSSKPPDDTWLDISFPGPGSAAVPPGMENGQVLGVLNVTKNPSDWGYKSGPTYTLAISGTNQTINPDDTYYLVRNDGSNYQLQKVDIGVSGGQLTIKFNPPGDTGVFTVIRAPMATPVPTPTPTPVPTETPTPTPIPASGSMWTYPIFVVLFIVGVIAGAAALYLLNIHR